MPSRHWFGTATHVCAGGAAAAILMANGQSITVAVRVVATVFRMHM